MGYNPQRYPKSGILSPQKGLNLSDNLFEMGVDEASRLQNILWRRDSLVQRYPFREFSSTSFAADGIFRGAHDYQPPAASLARLLFATNSGKIKERLTISTEADRVTGLATGQEVHFATVYDAVAMANGVDASRIGRDTTWRKMGSPASVSNLAVTPSGVGGFTGSFLHIVIPVIEVSGVGAVFADWSNIVKTAASGHAQFGLTWTDVVDSRISAYYYFRTAANGSTLNFVARILPGVGTYTDTTADTALPVSSSAAPARAPGLHAWGVPPIAKFLVFSGGRAVWANIVGAENGIQCSQIAGTSYEAEGVPGDGSTLIYLPKDGPVTAAFPVGTTTGDGRGNDLFVSQGSACYILPETNPDLPLRVISEELGCIGQRAHAQYGPWLFFQSKRGVEFWPGAGQDLYLLSDKIQAAFDGGGNDALAPNQSSDDIRYTIAENHLWITVRDSASAACPNKAYCLDLLRFKRALDPVNPARAARFVGPQMNTGLGFGLLLRRLDGSLLDFDSETKKILSYDKTGTQDQIAGAAANIPVVVQHGPFMREDPLLQKVPQFAHIFMFCNSATTLTLLAEYQRLTSQGTAQPNTYSLIWEDIIWDDLTWNFDSWFQETPLEWGAQACKWFVPRIEKSDAEVNFAYFGIVFWYHAFSAVRTFR